MHKVHLFSDELIQPARIKTVPVKSIRLEQRDEVLHRRPKVSADRELLEREDHVPPSDLPRLSPAEAVTELGVGELMKTASSGHAEVAPHIVAATEVELCDCTTAGPKTLQVCKY